MATKNPLPTESPLFVAFEKVQPPKMARGAGRSSSVPEEVALALINACSSAPQEWIGTGVAYLGIKQARAAQAKLRNAVLPYVDPELERLATRMWVAAEGADEESTTYYIAFRLMPPTKKKEEEA